MLYLDFCIFLNKLKEIAAKNKQQDFLIDLLTDKNPSDVFIISTITSGHFYEHNVFNFSDKQCIHFLSEYYKISILELNNLLKEKGDLGDVVIHLDSSLKSLDSLISLEKIYEMLIVLSTTKGKDSFAEKKKILFDIFKELGNIEKSYLIKIIIGKLRIFISEMTIISVLQKILKNNGGEKDIVEEAYMVSGNLEKIIKYVYSRNFLGLMGLTIPRIGSPIYPAAAERLDTAEDIYKKLNQSCTLEPKLDGLRIQIHLAKNTILLFSRNLKNVTHSFPDIVEELQKIYEKNLIADIIFDAEIVSYDNELNIYKSFQETSERRRKHNIDDKISEHPLHCVIFDCLYIDGKSLLDTPCEERRKELEKLIIFNNVIYLMPSHIINSPFDISHYFNHYISTGYEGVMIKAKNGIYHRGKRSFHWIKWKRSSKQFIQDSLDVVIVGYFYGEGKSSVRGIGALLVAVYDTNSDQFVTCAKVGTGLKQGLWIELKKKLDELKVDTNINTIITSKMLNPDVLVEPKIVISIEGDELTKSKEHSSGFGIRFPRLINIVKDKNVDQITTVNELEHLFKLQKGL
jgi:DNA ligase-1